MTKIEGVKCQEITPDQISEFISWSEYFRKRKERHIGPGTGKTTFSGWMKDGKYFINIKNNNHDETIILFHGTFTVIYNDTNTNGMHTECNKILNKKEVEERLEWIKKQNPTLIQRIKNLLAKVLSKIRNH